MIDPPRRVIPPLSKHLVCLKDNSIYITKQEITYSLFSVVDSECFELIQTFHTTTGSAVTSFEIRNDMFVAFANYRDSLGGFKANSPIYVLQQNSFTLNQTLTSFGATDVEYFTIHGEHFLVVANGFNGYSQKQNSNVFRWEAGKFNVFQYIPTNGVRDTHYFTINRRNFLSFSKLLQVSVCEWQNSKSSSKIQDIQIRNPRRCNTFTIDRVTYIACGRSLDSGADFTTFLAWSGEQFEPFWHHSESSIYGQQNVFIANDTVYFATRNVRQNAVSRIFLMTGIEFIYHQSIQIWPYAKGWESFNTPKGEVFVIVANYEYHKYTQSYAGYKVKSAVYKSADNRLNLYQQLPTTGAVYVHAFTHKRKIYVAVVNHFNGTSFNLNSEIYVWN